MDVRIRFEGGLNWYHHLSEFRMLVPEGTRLGTLLFQLGVEPGECKVTVNGSEADTERLVANGDDIVIRPISGS